MSANVKFQINGKVYTDVVDRFDIIYMLDQDTGSVSASASSEIKLTGEGFEDIQETFFNDCEGRTKKMDVTILPNCTEPLEGFEILPEGISMSPSICTATVNVSKKENKSCLAELQDTVFWKKGFLEAAESGDIDIPKVFYCVQNSPFISTVLFILRAVLFPILIFLELVENFVNFFGADVNIPSLDDWDNVITGCGRYHHAPLIKDIISFHAERCGLTFASSIFIDDPVYANTGLFESALEKGPKNTEDVTYHFENSTNMTVGDILNALKIPFNADYRIIGDVLYFERLDFFETRRDIELFNLEGTYLENLDDAPIYNINKASAYAYFRGEYKTDRFDSQGQRTLDFAYRDIVEWNDPPQPIGEEWQTGEKRVDIPFGGVRHMFDRLTCDKGDGQDLNDLIVDKFRHGKPNGGFGTFGFGRKRAIITDKHMLEYPKLLVFEQGFDVNDALVIRREHSERKGWQCYDYNFPLWMDAEYDIPELYQSFHYIDDPRKADIKRDYYTVKSIQYAPEDFCADVKKINDNFHDLYVSTIYGRGYPASYEVDFDECLITITDIFIPCQ